MRFLNVEEAAAALRQMDILLAEKSRDRGYHIDLEQGLARAGEEHCAYIRELLSIAMKRVGTASAPKKAKTAEA